MYFDGERYFLVPDEEPMASQGPAAWTVDGDERRLTPVQVDAFEVSEAEAEAFIQLEIKDTVDRFRPVFVDLMLSLGQAPDPGEAQVLLAAVQQTIAAVVSGDQGAIERFRERATRVAGAIEATGRAETADAVRRLPDALVELFGRR